MAQKSQQGNLREDFPPTLQEVPLPMIWINICVQHQVLFWGTENKYVHISSPQQLKCFLEELNMCWHQMFKYFVQTG